MIFTTANGSYIPPPKTWKGNATRSTIPAWSRPYTNSTHFVSDPNDPIILGPQPSNGEGGVRGPNPIKHWRKSTKPRKVEGNSGASYSIQDKPGTSNTLDDKDCCQSKFQPNNSLWEYIPDDNLDSHDTNQTLQQTPNLNNPIVKAVKAVNQGRKFCCNPEANRIRSAMNTVPINPVIRGNGQPTLYKEYSFSTKEYLKSKTRSYEQNLSGTKISTAKYVGGGSILEVNIGLLNSIGNDDNWVTLIYFNIFDESGNYSHTNMKNIASLIATYFKGIDNNAHGFDKVHSAQDFLNAFDALEKKAQIESVSTDVTHPFGDDSLLEEINNVFFVVHESIKPLPYTQQNENMYRNPLDCPPETCDGQGPAKGIVVKPNNHQYFQQGAVDSSSRIARLKYNTVTKNANSFNSAMGMAAANAGKYRPDGNAPYFIKSKYQECIPFIRRNTQGFTSCKRTNPSETVRQSKTVDIVYSRVTE